MRAVPALILGVQHTEGETVPLSVPTPSGFPPPDTLYPALRFLVASSCKRHYVRVRARRSTAHGGRHALIRPRALTPDWPRWGSHGRATSPSLSVTGVAKPSSQVQGPRPTPCHCPAWHTPPHTEAGGPTLT
ncbi:unnamed protein product [Pleuronectes platessa]|uniref:Uncharacterized protein n=1 Tax=Pleuronectes platessa TaxID=8262 RepID=A0A9N7UG06_PLEPL|nr:unnamed protein product [Pleuronectes platessa]